MSEMAPSNRRVRPPALPPEVLEEAGVDDVAPLEDEAPPEPPRPRKAKVPVTKGMAIARALVGAALVVGLSTAVAWAARHHVVSSSRFAVTSIDVTGTRHRTSDEIVREAGLQVGANVFTVDLDAARAKLLADPWVTDATLARRLPGTLLVQVSEREAGALVAMDEVWLATRDGDLFKKLEDGDPADLPVVTGIAPADVTHDRVGVQRTIRRAIDLAAEYDHSALARKATLQEIHVGEDGAMTLVVGKAGVALELGGPPFRRKLEEASRVVAELEKRGTKADAIMLDNEARPDRVVVRVR